MGLSSINAARSGAVAPSFAGRDFGPSLATGHACGHRGRLHPDFGNLQPTDCPTRAGSFKNASNWYVADPRTLGTHAGRAAREYLVDHL